MSAVEYGIENGIIEKASTEDEEIFIIHLRSIPFQKFADAIMDELKSEGFDIEVNIPYAKATKKIKPPKDKTIEDFEKVFTFQKNTYVEMISSLTSKLLLASECLGISVDEAYSMAMYVMYNDLQQFLTETNIKDVFKGSKQEIKKFTEYILGD